MTTTAVLLVLPAPSVAVRVMVYGVSATPVVSSLKPNDHDEPDPLRFADPPDHDAVTPVIPDGSSALTETVETSGPQYALKPCIVMLVGCADALRLGPVVSSGTGPGASVGVGVGVGADSGAAITATGHGVPVGRTAV